MGERPAANRDRRFQNQQAASHRVSRAGLRGGHQQQHGVQHRVLRYSYQSLVTPSSIFDYDMNTRKATLLKQTEVPGGFDKANYTSERVFATASDGTKIPISIVYRKGVKLRRLGADAALRLRLVWRFDYAGIFVQPSGLARSRRGLSPSRTFAAAESWASRGAKPAA